MITSPMVDEEERVAVLDRVRDDPSASPNMLLRRRNRLKHLLNDGSGVLGSSRESGPRVGLTAAQQVKERKVGNIRMQKSILTNMILSGITSHHQKCTVQRYKSDTKAPIQTSQHVQIKTL